MFICDNKINGTVVGREELNDCEGSDGMTWSLVPPTSAIKPDPLWQYVWRPEQATAPSWLETGEGKVMATSGGLVVTFVVFVVVILSPQRPELLEFDWSAIDLMVADFSRTEVVMSVPVWYIGGKIPVRQFFVEIPVADRKAHELVEQPIVHDVGTRGTSLIRHKAVKYPLFVDRIRWVWPSKQAKYGKKIELGKHSFEFRWIVLSVETIPLLFPPPTPCDEDPTGLLDVS